MEHCSQLGLFEQKTLCCIDSILASCFVTAVEMPPLAFSTAVYSDLTLRALRSPDVWADSAELFDHCGSSNSGERALTATVRIFYFFFSHDGHVPEDKAVKAKALTHASLVHLTKH
jgi:hypothetical protein